MVELGIRAVAYAPIRSGDDLLGVVAVGTCDEAYARHLIDRLPAVGEFAVAANALLSGQLERGHRDELVRERVRRVLAKGGLRPVFQPIVALASGEPLGYEALTRFVDGTPPDRMIAEAHSVGLGLELEVACLAAALDAAEALPQDAWLSLNASPDLILHSTELAALLADRSRRFVLEITEHVEIDDYAAVRAAVAALGPTVSLAVDDAGAGFASLRHVVELAPRFLKLDISLVRHVDRDLTRQAMIAGLSQFAARVGSELIAEGIEDSAELQMLRELGVPLGQGYLLGRPEAVSRPTDEA
jgi:FOG: EAL domain